MVNRISIHFRRSVFVCCAYATLAFLFAPELSAMVFADDAKTQPSAARKSQADKKAKKRSRLEQAIDHSFERFKVYEKTNPKPLQMKSVLTWNNPLAGGLGKFRTVVYVRDGQPKAVCCVYGGAKNLNFEFGAMSRKADLRGELDGGRSWEMSDPGLVFRPVHDSDKPRDSRALRLFQMKKIMRRFKAIERISRTGETTREELRLLTTPLYRYEKESKTVVDGAVFCFAQVTDPEALVLLEAVKNNGSVRWEYAFLRRTSYPVTGQLDGQSVWTTEDIGTRLFRQVRIESPTVK